MECGNELTQRFEGAQPDEHQPPPPPSTEPMAAWKKFVLIVCSIFIFPVGLVWGLVYLVSKVSPDRKRMGKWAVGISALMLVIVVVTPASEQSDAGDAAVESEVQSTQESVDQEVPAESEAQTSAEADLPTVTAVQLYKEFDDNQIAAKKEYGGQRYRITGTIDDIGRDILDTTYVTLKTGDPMWSVQCMFSRDEEDAVAAVSKGDQVTIEGEVADLETFNVVVRYSQLADK